MSEVKQESVEKESNAPNVPYNCMMGWIKKILELNKTTRLDTIDRKYIIDTQLTNPSDSSKLTNALRFLQLTDSNDKTTEKMHLLQSEGEIFVQNLAKIVREAYKDLMSSVQVNIAKPEHIYSFFVDRKNAGFTLTQAKKATRFFVWLANWAGIELSPELKKLAPNPDAKPREARQARSKTAINDDYEVEEVQDEVQSPKKTQIQTLSRTITPASNIQATINMTLNNETRLEIWVMVLRLLGLKDKDEEIPTTESKPN